MMMELQNYQDLLERYSEFQRRAVKHKIEQFNNLLKNYLKCYKEYYDKNRTLAPNFNPLYLFNLKFDELTHSNILAWAFDPYETHNQGDLFFKHFLDFFNFNVNYKSWDYKVKREHPGKESIIDILIYGRDFIFYIENKTLSPEGDSQTDREYCDLRRCAKSLNIKKNIFPIFLSPGGVEPENKNWIPISYCSLAQVFEKCLDKIQSNYVRFFIKSWLSLLKSMEV